MQWLINLFLHRGNDLPSFFLPNAYFFKRSVLNLHQIPFWNPIQFSGSPYAADPQNYIFYPLNYLFLILEVEVAFLVLLMFHFLLAAVGTYIVTRRVFKIQKVPALFASFVFILTPKLISHLEAGHYTMIVAFSLLPWFLLFAVKFIQKPSVKKAIATAVVLWTMYINYINIAYFAILFFLAYSIFHFISNKQKINLKLFAIGYSLFVLFFLGLISPVLLPQLELGPLSTRSRLQFTDVAQPIWSLKLFAQNLLFPFKLSGSQLSTERVLFPGITVLLLAVLGWVKRVEKDKYVFLGWLVFSLLFALGDRIPFFIFFYKFFPLMRWMRVTTRLFIISNLVIAIFAGLGLQFLLTKFPFKKKILKVIFLITVLSLSFTEIVLINRKIFSRSKSLQDPLPESLYSLIIKDPEKNFRVYCPTGCLSLQRLGELNIHNIAGNNPVQLESTIKFLQKAGGYQYRKYIPILPPYESFDQQPQPVAKLLARLNAKYIASPYPLTSDGLLLQAEDSGFFLYKNSLSRALQLTRDGSASYQTFTPNKLVVNVNTTQDNTLVLSEIYYPGWRAFNQLGRQLKISDAKPFRAVPIDPSTTQVTFFYFPTSLTIGVIIFTITLIFIIYAYYHPQLFFRVSPKRRRSLRKRVK